MTENAVPPAAPGSGEDDEPQAGRAPVIRIPGISLVVLVGVSGCGKSTFARKHFRPTEVLSSDFFRAMVRDDENDQTATADAFDVLHFVARRRLLAGRLTVVDATNVRPAAREPLLALARECNVTPVAIVLDLPEDVCAERNRGRAGRQVPPHVVSQQHAQLHGGLGELGREGFRHVFVLDRAAAVDAATVVREPLWNERKADMSVPAAREYAEPAQPFLPEPGTEAPVRDDGLT
ncbi:AAA family ATPase [Longimicrobium sp.]|uniref:AAA family ATPase n=1 Tax=Longimicrobium sp. TaxID=2029185 RepID=UPI002B66668C|nr:AAA family ATPase [Longimicrobium sp.]HSU16825.1 AAA family ATPase [Longimicrobium sp.]